MSGIGGGAPDQSSRHTAATKRKALNRISTPPAAAAKTG